MQPVIEVNNGKVSILFPKSCATTGGGAYVLSLDETIIDDAFAKATASETGKKEGPVQGSASKLNPTSHSTRAEAAVVLNKLLSCKFD